MEDLYTVKLSKVIKEFALESIYLSDLPENIEISCSSINRPGLQMVGFYDIFTEVFGKIEGVNDTFSALTYLKTNFDGARDFDSIYSLINDVISSGKLEIEESSSKLVECAKSAYEAQKALVKKNGKSALVLYPGLSLIVLILLM